MCYSYHIMEKELEEKKVLLSKEEETYYASLFTKYAEADASSNGLVSSLLHKVGGNKFYSKSSFFTIKTSIRRPSKGIRAI